MLSRCAEIQALSGQCKGCCRCGKAEGWFYEVYVQQEALAQCLFVRAHGDYRADPGVSAWAGDVIGVYNIQLFYEDGNAVQDTDAEGNAYHETMKEGDTLQLSYKLIDCEIPDNGYVKWYSEAPTLVDVDQNGLVKAFDSSKGAVIHNWIDNEVKPVPLVGKIAGAALEKPCSMIR